MSVLSSERPGAVGALAGGEEIPLPAPRLDGGVSVEAALAARRTVRTFAAQPLTADEVGQLLWAAQGVTDAEGRRTAPSAGATFPLEVDAVTADGAWRYVPVGHRLVPRLAGDVRPALRVVSRDQAQITEAPLLIAVSAIDARTEPRYGPRTPQYLAMEAGHVAQNVLLEAVALGLGAVPMGAFDEAAVHDILRLADGEAPLYLLAVGHPR